MEPASILIIKQEFIIKWLSCFQWRSKILATGLKTTGRQKLTVTWWLITDNMAVYK